MLPKSAEDGTVIWYGTNSTHGVGRLVQVQPDLAVRNFSCGYQFVLCGSWLDYSSEDIGLYGTGSLGNAWPQICAQPYGDGSCSGDYAGGYGSGMSYMWSSTDTSIAPVQGTTTDQSATFYGQSVGSTQGNAYLYDGYGCVSESGGSVSVNCTFPTGDTTQMTSWDDSQGNPSIGNWIQTLIPAGTAFDGDAVVESSPYAGSDTCWYAESGIQPLVAVSGQTWIVSSGTWLYDQVGYFPNAVKTYQQRPQRGLSLPCGFNVPQYLTIYCPANQSTIYKSDFLTGTVAGTGVNSGRDGQVVGRTYQP